MKSMYSEPFLATSRNVLEFIQRNTLVLVISISFGIGYGVYQSVIEVKRYETTFIAQTKESSSTVAVQLLNSLNGKSGELIQMEGLSIIEIEAKSQMTNVQNDSINIGGVEIQFRYSNTIDLNEVAERLETFINTEEVMQGGGDLIVSQNFPDPISIESGWFKNILKNVLKYLIIGLAIALVIDLRKALKIQKH